ncbi:MAG: FAD-binding oxidoreductase [Pseudomonadota bacterium]
MDATYPRSFWLDEALAEDEANGLQPAPSLSGDIQADVCIVGGGYTGLWTALDIKAFEPSLDVVLIEKDVCASGASGRNAGFLLSLWAKYTSLVKVCGEEEALRIAKASHESVSDVMQFANENAIDADIQYDGWLWAATNDAQLGLWTETIDAIAKHGESPIEVWSGEQAAARGGTQAHIGGAFERHSARVQPALLARGIRRVAIERGVRIYEHTPLEQLDHGNPVSIKTPTGTIKADKVVLAMNAWASRWPEIRKSIIVVTSDMVVTDPIPDELDATGWKDGVTVSDGRTLVEYYRTTRDRRLAFGKGGMSGTFSFGGRIGNEVEGASDYATTVAAAMRQTFPSLSNVGIHKSWRGPIDRSKVGLPRFWKLDDRENVFYGVGFSGNGIGPCNLAGKILSSMVLEKQDEWANCGLVRPASRDFPPEPFRALGSRMIRGALAAKDEADDEGRDPGWAAKFAMQFAPAGVSPFKSKKG